MNIEEAHDFEKIRSIIEDLNVAMLATTDDEMNIRTRPMYTVDMDADQNIWFFTQDDSGKVKEMTDNHHVNLSYACPKSGKYLSVSGTASFCHDQDRKHELFNIFGKAWFPEGVDDPSLLLIKVNPDQAEYWETTSSKLVQLFKITKAIVTDQAYDGGQHGQIRNI